MHGAGGGAPIGNRNALQDGRYTAEATRDRKIITALIHESRDLAEIT